MKKKFYDDVKHYSIKQTSALTGVNEKTLRYYDEIGLMSPLYRNEENKYRYYTIKQFYQIENFKLAKRMGLPLKEYTSLQVTGQEIEEAQFARSRETYDSVIQEHRNQIQKLEEQISLMEEFKENLNHFEQYIHTGQPYVTERGSACLLIVPMDPSNQFERTSQKARTLIKDPRYRDVLTPYWGILLDADAMKDGKHKIVYQYCRLNTFIDDENTLIMEGGIFDTLIGRAWINGEHEPLTEYLNSHEYQGPYLIAEELAIFDEVDHIYHQIFVRKSSN